MEKFHPGSSLRGQVTKGIMQWMPDSAGVAVPMEKWTQAIHVVSTGSGAASYVPPATAATPVPHRNEKEGRQFDDELDGLFREAGHEAAIARQQVRSLPYLYIAHDREVLKWSMGHNKYSYTIYMWTYSVEVLPFLNLLVQNQHTIKDSNNKLHCHIGSACQGGLA